MDPRLKERVPVGGPSKARNVTVIAADGRSVDRGAPLKTWAARHGVGVNPSVKNARRLDGVVAGRVRTADLPVEARAGPEAPAADQAGRVPWLLAGGAQAT